MLQSYENTFCVQNNNTIRVAQLSQNSMHCLGSVDILQNGARVTQRRRILIKSFFYLLFYRSPCYVSGPWSCKDPCCLWRVRHLNLCSEDERRSYGFGTTWGGVINDRIVIFRLNNTKRILGILWLSGWLLGCCQANVKMSRAVARLLIRFSTA